MIDILSSSLWEYQVVPTRKILLTLLAATSSRKGPFRNGADDHAIRRFTIHQVLPPLVSIDNSAIATTTSTLSMFSTRSEPLPVVYTNDPKSAREWADRHLWSKNNGDHHRDSNRDGDDDDDDDDVVVVVGFDMESSPDLPWRKKGVDSYFGPATIQLAVIDSALVMQIGQEGHGPIPDIVPLLNDIFSDPSLLTVGVGLDQDFIELYRWLEEYSFFANAIGGHDATECKRILGGTPPRMDLGGIGAVDSSSSSNSNDDNNGRTTRGTVGLKRLAGSILRVDLPKNKKISRSRWASVPLTKEQISYAARDAWVSAAVVHQLSILDEGRFAATELMKAFLRSANVDPSPQLVHDDDGSNNTTSFSIATLSERGSKRQRVRQKYKALRDQEGPWSSEERILAASLEEELRQLAPPAPLTFEIVNLLGINPYVT